MNATSFRPLQIQEQKILDKLLSVDFPGRDAIRQQISDCEVKEWQDGSYSLEFRTRSSMSADVVDRVPVEGKFGPNGVIQILLHVVEKKIKYLEFVTYHLANIENLPTPDEIILQVKK